jgi:glycerol kinase
MAANDWLCGFLAGMLDRPVERPAMLETTALGAAFLAGLGVGLWPDLNTLADLRGEPDVFTPALDGRERERLLAGWRQALSLVLR